MEAFHRLFIVTTDPATPYIRLLNFDVFLSVFIHAIVYTISYVLICKLFGITTWKKNLNIVFFGLIILMILGYFGRLYRTKSIAVVVKSDQVAKHQVRNGYFGWYFLG
jgi:hypothetical protein